MAAPFPAPVKTWHNAVYDEISPKRPELSAKGKIVVVTGGGIGIGRSVALAFAEAGAPTIAIVGRTEKALAEAKRDIENQYSSTKIVVLVADITEEASFTKTLTAFKQTHGAIDIFVHNAGYMSDLLPVGDADVNEAFKSFEINVKGAMVATKAFLPLAAADAVLIAMGTGAMSFLMPKGSAYLTSKMAATRFFEFVQLENPHIRVHNLHPGGIQTRMAEKTQAAGMEIPMDHDSLPGAFTVWLASPEAAFTKGKFLWSNWDVTELKAQREKLAEGSFLTMGGGLDGWPFIN